MNIKILTIEDRVLEYYRNNIKGNEVISRDECARKLTRSMMLGMSFRKTDDGGVVYAYGRLRFKVKNGGVKWIENYHKVLPMWNRDNKKYVELTLQLGLDSVNIKLVEHDRLAEAGRLVRRKSKRIANIKKHLLYLQRDITKVVGECKETKWLVDNIETILSIVDTNDNKDSAWNSQYR